MGKKKIQNDLETKLPTRFVKRSWLLRDCMETKLNMKKERVNKSTAD
jgi:hypothetical protein